jgi:6-phosphogluconolactonase
MSVAIYPDSDTLSHEAAQYVVRIASEAITTHGRFTLALAGGSTPKKLYALLASEPYQGQIDWSRSEIFWSDERCVPPTSEDSNYHLALETLLSKVPLSPSQIHRMPAEAANRDEAALAYTQEIQRVFGTNGIPSFDLLQLGMGPEAHTASLFPHQASLYEQTRLIIPVTVPKPPPPRLTFTPPLLNAAAHILFLVTGQDKAGALQEVLEGEYNPDEYPAQIIRPTQGEVTWMLDPAAASKLQTQHV